MLKTPRRITKEYIIPDCALSNLLNMCNELKLEK